MVKQTDRQCKSNTDRQIVRETHRQTHNIHIDGQRERDRNKCKKK